MGKPAYQSSSTQGPGGAPKLTVVEGPAGSFFEAYCAKNPDRAIPIGPIDEAKLYGGIVSATRSNQLRAILQAAARSAHISVI